MGLIYDKVHAAAEVGSKQIHTEHGNLANFARSETFEGQQTTLEKNFELLEAPRSGPPR